MSPQSTDAHRPRGRRPASRSRAVVRRSTLLLAVALAGCGLGAQAPAPPRSAPAAPTVAPAAKGAPPAAPTGRIAYVCEQRGRASVCVVGPDGSGLTPVDTGPGQAFPGPPDPRGDDVLVVRSVDGAPSTDDHTETLLRVPLAGGAPVVLAPPSTRIRNPAWDPSGSWIVFEADAASFRDLYRVPRSGDVPPTRLTSNAEGNFEPDVRHDGAAIAFASSRDGQAEIYRMAADGSDARRLTTSPGDDVRPRWAPDGAHLAFLTRREGRLRAWVMDADGKAPHPVLSDGTEEHLDLHWSPDGRYLLLDVGDAGAFDLAVVDVQAGERVARIGGPGPDRYGAWSPDGAWVAWTAQPDGGGLPDLWVARRDGDRAHAITASPDADWLPRWLPE